MKKTAKLFIALLALVMFCSLPVSASVEAKRVYSKNREKIGKIALTFDDGPHPRYTPQIISILKEYDITATFFIIGVNAVLYPDALKEISECGYEIGNHTFSHQNLRNKAQSDIIRELSECESAVSQKNVTLSKIFRPPQGAYTQDAQEVANALGYDIILWSIDTEDWAHTPPSVIIEKVLSSLKDGDIILMHDYVSGKNTTCDALRTMIPAILERGYEFVTVSELITE